MFLGFNLLVALVLMEANMFDFLNTILGFYANCGMAWVVVVDSDIVFNKYLLKLSPMKPEFRRGMIYPVNPVGFGSMIIAATSPRRSSAARASKSPRGIWASGSSGPNPRRNSSAPFTDSDPVVSPWNACRA